MPISSRRLRSWYLILRAIPGYYLKAATFYGFHPVAAARALTAALQARYTPQEAFIHGLLRPGADAHTGTNVIDNFRRGATGNLIARVHVETGKLFPAVTYVTGEGFAPLSSDASGALPTDGFQLPLWDDMKALARRAAPCLSKGTSRPTPPRAGPQYTNFSRRFPHANATAGDLTVSPTSTTFRHYRSPAPSGSPVKPNRTTVIALAGMLLAVAGCAPKQPYDVEKIEAIRAEAQTLIRAQAVMGYASWAEGLPSNQDSLYRAHAHLFTLQNIRLVADAAAAEPDSVQGRRLRYLHRFLATEYVAMQTAELGDRVSNYEAAATVPVDGKPVPYRQLSALMANEPAPDRRAALYTAAGTVLDSLNVLLREAREQDRRSVAELGYSSYTGMVEDLKGFSLSDLGSIAEQILVTTQDQYTMLLRGALAADLRLAPERFHRYDTAPLFRSRAFDRFFSGAAMLPTLGAAYRGLGIDVDSLRNLTIDAVPREAKNPRAVCFAVDVPDDIRLSIKPIGGVDDYRGIFHEMGHALHYAHTMENAFEFKYLGEYTVTETYAFLSQHLLENQAWLRMRSGMPTPVLKDYVRLSALLRLYMIRRYAAKVLYERELWSGVSNPGRMYAEIMSRAVGTVPLPDDEKRHLIDVDPLFYSATYLRAWFLEAQLNARLARDFGFNWFENPDAGAYLRSLWARGDRLNGDELAALIGEEAISPEALLQQIALMITFSTKPGA